MCRTTMDPLYTRGPYFDSGGLRSHFVLRRRETEVYRCCVLAQGIKPATKGMSSHLVTCVLKGRTKKLSPFVIGTSLPVTVIKR